MVSHVTTSAFATNQCGFRKLKRGFVALILHLSTLYTHLEYPQGILSY